MCVFFLRQFLCPYSIRSHTEYSRYSNLHLSFCTYPSDGVQRSRKFPGLWDNTHHPRLYVVWFFIFLIPMCFVPDHIRKLFGRRALDAAGNFSPPRSRIHLISSRPSSTFTGLARHEPVWPWVASMSRSKAYRRVSSF